MFRAAAAALSEYGGGMRVEVDRARPSFVVQGGWWYRGEHTVEDHPKGALLVYKVFNAAEDHSWMVPLMWRSHRRRMASPEERIARIGGRLGTKAYEA